MDFEDVRRKLHLGDDYESMPDFYYVISLVERTIEVYDADFSSEHWKRGELIFRGIFAEAKQNFLDEMMTPQRNPIFAKNRISSCRLFLVPKQKRQCHLVTPWNPNLQIWNLGVQTFRFGSIFSGSDAAASMPSRNALESKP